MQTTPVQLPSLSSALFKPALKLALMGQRSTEDQDTLLRSPSLIQTHTASSPRDQSSSQVTHLPRLNASLGTLSAP